GSGDGTFLAPLPFGVGCRPLSVFVGDFNGHRKLDVAVAKSSSTTVSVVLGNSDGSLQKPLPLLVVGTSPISVAVGDFNGDGKPDLAVANLGSNTVSVLMGTSTVTVPPPVTSITAATPACTNSRSASHSVTAPEA